MGQEVCNDSEGWTKGAEDVVSKLEEPTPTCKQEVHHKAMQMIFAICNSAFQQEKTQKRELSRLQNQDLLSMVYNAMFFEWPTDCQDVRDDIWCKVRQTDRFRGLYPSTWCEERTMRSQHPAEWTGERSTNTIFFRDNNGIVQPYTVYRKRDRSLFEERNPKPKRPCASRYQTDDWIMEDMDEI